VFGIGFAKTGTSSLCKALNLVGFSACHWDQTRKLLSYEEGKLSIDFSLIKSRYDAFTDLPVARIYRALDQRFPGSKFILTIRKPAEWFKSHESWETTYGKLHNGPFEQALNKKMYRTAEPSRSENISALLAHNREVKRYFSDREEQLLTLDITIGEGWEKLCPFLDVAQPNTPFPKENVFKDKKNW
jgi:hypothetical protein